MSRAKIIFMPKLGSENYAMNNVRIVEKYSGWTYDTSDFAEYGYIYTNEENNIDTVNSKYWIKFKPINGYKFVKVFKTSSGGTYNSGDFEIASDGSVTIYPWNSGTATIVNNYVSFELAESTQTSFTVTQNLENCTSNAEQEYTENSDVSITLKSIDKYRFDTVPTITMNDTVIDFTLTDDKKTATLNFIVTNNFTINASANHIPHELTTDLTNCTCNFVDEIPHGKTTIVITANEGYELNGVVELYDTYDYITSTFSDFTNDNTVCTITIDVKGDIEITAQAIVKVEELSSFTNLYRVSSSILNDLSKVRFRNVEGSIVDYGSFITSLLKIPFNLNDEMVADTGDIQLGNYDSNVPAERLQKYVLCVPIGSIKIDEKYHNVYDYKDTTCILHLPYTENMVLQTEYVINQTITIEYKIDLYSGNCTVNVFSSFTNSIVESKMFNIGSNIPFMQEQNNSVVSNVKAVLDNGVKTAFIEVVRNIPYNINSVFGNETVDFGTLENYAGYIKVSDIILNIGATNDEKDEIENLLKNGVFINENSVEL